jgi:hypothetical protein
VRHSLVRGARSLRGLGVGYRPHTAVAEAKQNNMPRPRKHSMAAIALRPTSAFVTLEAWAVAVAAAPARAFEVRLGQRMLSEMVAKARSYK